MNTSRIYRSHTIGAFAGIAILLWLAVPLFASTYLPLFIQPPYVEKRAAAVSMTVGSASNLFPNQRDVMDGCFDLAMDRLDQTRWFAIATCQFSENSYGHKAGLIRDENGVLTFTEIGIENTYFDDREVKVRIVSSLVAEPVDGGWRIVSILLNQVKRENGTIFSGFLSEDEMETVGYVFQFGEASAPILSGKLELVRGLRDAEVADHFVLFAGAGRSSREVFDHSSGWHQVVIPYDSVTDISTHRLITGRDASGALTFLDDPWGLNYATVDAWNAVNREASDPGVHPETGEPWWLVWPGTYTRLSDKEDTFQGGVLRMAIDGQPVYIACHTNGVKRWHEDLVEKSESPKADCQTAAKLGVAPVTTGTVDLSFQGTGDFAPGWFWHLAEDVSGNAFVGISSLNMEPHQMPVELTITLVEETQ